MKIIRFILQLVGAMTLTGATLCLSLLYFAGHWMHVHDEPVKADYILPLSGDDNRLITAAELFKQGYAPAILLSNAKRLPYTRLDRLKWKMGYPKHTKSQLQDLILEILDATSSRHESFGNDHISTVEEAEALKEHLNGRNPSLLIITSPYHARRAKSIFEDVFPDATITVTTIQEDAFQTAWWKDQRSAQNLIMEFAKTLHYMAGGVFRSTDDNY